MKHPAPFSNANNSSILGEGMRVKIPFFVPVAGVTEGNMEFCFL